MPVKLSTTIGNISSVLQITKCHDYTMVLGRIKECASLF